MMQWSKDIAHRLRTLLAPMLGMIPGATGGVVAFDFPQLSYREV